jgi:hypothetical protein
MRYLHPVSHQEKFVASGTYVTSVVGEDPPAQTTEEWSIHIQPGGSRFIRIDRAATVTPTSEHLLSEVLQSPEGWIERIDLVWFRQVVSRRVSLTAFETYVQVGYKTEPGEREYLEVELPAGTRLLPPFLLFTLGAVNVPVLVTEGHRLKIDVTTPVNPPPLRVASIRWTRGDVQSLNIGRKQIDALVYESRSGDTVLKAWQDQRLQLPVRIEDYQAGQLTRTSELRSVAF